MGRATIGSVDAAFQNLFDVVEQEEAKRKPETVESILDSLPTVQEAPESVESILSEIPAVAETEQAVSPPPVQRQPEIAQPVAGFGDLRQAEATQEPPAVQEHKGKVSGFLASVGAGFREQAEAEIEGGKVVKRLALNPKDTLSAMRLFAEGLRFVPQEVAVQALNAMQGTKSASVVDRSLGERMAAKFQVEEDREKFIKEAARRYGKRQFLPGIPIASVAELPQNIGFSGASLLGGAAVGVPIGFLPVPGARPAAVYAGTVVSGALAFNMASHQIMQEYLELKNAESVKQRGRGINQEEENQLKKQFESAAVKHGLWEAIPEMIATGIGASNLLRPLSKVAGKSVATQIAGRLASTYAGEAITETVTEMGQRRVRATEALPGARDVDFSNPSDWLSALKDIAPQTFLLTTVTAGVGVGSVATAKRISALRQEIGETHPQFEQFANKIKDIETQPVSAEQIDPDILQVPRLQEGELVSVKGSGTKGVIEEIVDDRVAVRMDNGFLARMSLDDVLRASRPPLEQGPVGDINQAGVTVGAVPEVGEQEFVKVEDIPEGEDVDALKELGYNAKQIDQMLPEEAGRILSSATPADRSNVIESGEVVSAPPPAGDIETEVIKEEPQFIDESPPIGLGIKQVIPPEIEVIKPEKDLSGFTGLFMRWMSPVRTLMPDNPTVSKIARDGRATMQGMANDINHYGRRVDAVKRGLNAAEQEQVVEFLESDRDVDLANIPTKLQPAYTELDNIRSEMLDVIRDDMGIDTSRWGMTAEQFWPHVFVGEYQIQVEDDGRWSTIDGGFARNVREAVDKASTVLTDDPNANIRIKPKGFNNDYSATMLTRKAFGRFIGEVKKATQLDKSEIVSMLRGVAAIKPRGKFVGNFKQRQANLGGYMKEFDAMKIYTSRVLRKKWLDPFRKQADADARTLPPSLQKYFLQYIDDVSGKYDADDNKFVIRTATSRLTRAQSALKLGFRLITALVNRLQPTQLAFGEIGTYLYRGNIFKRTAKGREIVERSGIAGELPVFAEGATGATRDFAQNVADVITVRRKVPVSARLRAAQNISLAMFSVAEQANRADTVAGGYLFARKVFSTPRAKAEKRGLGYVYSYLDEFEDAETAAIEYGKDLNTDVNFIVSNADLPLILRGPVRKTVLQFKSFPINFAATTLKWTAEFIKDPWNPHFQARAARMLAANLLVGGVRAIPFVGRKIWWTLMGAALLSGDAPRERVKEVLGRGVLSLLGADVSGRVGPGEFLPREMEDLLGPLAGDVKNLAKFVEGDWDWSQLVKSTPALRDLVTAISETDDIVDPNKRDRMVLERTGLDRILQGVGIPLEKVNVTRDLQFMIGKGNREYTKNKAQIVDSIIDVMQDDSVQTAAQFKEAMAPILEKMEGEFIAVTSDEIITELSKKAEPALIRTFKQAPLARKPEILDMLFKINKAHRNIIKE